MLRASRVLASLLLLAGCAPSADDPRSRLDTWEAESGEFRIRYLRPPWEISEAEGDSLFLRIQSNANLAGGVDGGPGKFELRATVDSGDIETLVGAEERRLRRLPAEIRDGPRDVSTLEGVEGREVIAFENGDPYERFHRVAFFPLSGRRVLRLAFEATPNLETPEVDAMIAQVGIGATP